VKSLVYPRYRDIFGSGFARQPAIGTIHTRSRNQRIFSQSLFIHSSFRGGGILLHSFCKMNILPARNMMPPARYYVYSHQSLSTCLRMYTRSPSTPPKPSPSAGSPNTQNSSFIPRREFLYPSNLITSYFLGHHRAGLDKMKQLVSSVELIIECRDYRVPLSSRNPMFEETLQGKERLIVYTKRDLAAEELDLKVCKVSPNHTPNHDSICYFLHLLLACTCIDPRCSMFPIIVWTRGIIDWA